LNKKLKIKMKHIYITSFLMLTFFLNKLEAQSGTSYQINPSCAEHTGSLGVEVTTSLHDFPFPYTFIIYNEEFDYEAVLYQVDRNITLSEKLYLYNPKLKKFDTLIGNQLLNDWVGYCQYYGGVDMFDPITKKRYLWP